MRLKEDTAERQRFVEAHGTSEDSKQPWAETASYHRKRAQPPMILSRYLQAEPVARRRFDATVRRTMQSLLTKPVHLHAADPFVLLSEKMSRTPRASRRKLTKVYNSRSPGVIKDIVGEQTEAQDLPIYFCIPKQAWVLTNCHRRNLQNKKTQ